ncbi:MAG TPA: lipid-binding SYLF domain-containing protein [Steroidobacteraceae bacterium]|nr:lipid-binding SYLF domain-containing protein [Steroidobacteraceae bacterium]
MRGNCWIRSVAWLLAAITIGATCPRLAQAQDSAPPVDPPSPHVAAVAASAQRLVDSAVQAARLLRQDPRMAPLLDRAKAVLIVPHYKEGAVIIGAHGGVGVLLARRGSAWTDPVFYRMGGVSIGLQAGGTSGPVAMLLMSDKAVEKFRDSLSTWSLGGNTGLTVADFSDQKQHPAGSLDVIVWSAMKGLFGGIAFSATDVTPDTSADHAYYRSPVAPLQILVGSVTNPSAQPLRNALQTHVALN